MDAPWSRARPATDPREESAVAIAATSPRPADTPRSWLAVFSVALSASVFCAAEFLPVGILRYITQSFGVTEGSAGLLVTVPGILAAFAAPFLTVAIGRRDRRRVLLVLGALLVASNLIAMLAPNFATLLVGRALFGISIGGFWAIGAGLGGRLVAKPSVNRATSIIFAGVSVGMLVGGAAGALIGELLGWRVAFAAAFVLSVVAFLTQWIYLPGLCVLERLGPRSLAGIIETRNGRVGLAAMTCVLVGHYATYTYVTPFLSKVSGFGGTAISSLLLGYTIIGMLGNFIAGAADAARAKRTLTLTMLFVVAPLVALPLMGHVPIATGVLLAVWGTAYGALPVALQMWMAKAAPDASEGALALFVANFQFSISLGSLLGGLVVDRFGLGHTLYFGGAMGALGLFLFARFAQEERPEPEPAGRVHPAAGIAEPLN